MRVLIILLFATLGGFSALAMAQSDIRATKHNLSGASERDVAPISDPVARQRLEREVCVFCHTPTAENAAGGQDGAVQSLPRWQPAVTAVSSYELFDDIGRAPGLEVGGDAVGSTSVACLSCHDATQAFGVGLGVGGGNDDHPYGVPYRGVDLNPFEMARMRGALASGELPFRIAARVVAEADFHPARSAMVNQRQVWWASSAAGAQRTKSDLPLYPRRARADDAASVVVPFVECTSCHDPHTTQSRFLRVDNNQGKLCLSCHVK